MGRIADAAGQVLKDLSVDNNADITKFVSCKHKQSKLVKIHFRQNQEMRSVPIVRR